MNKVPRNNTANLVDKEVRIVQHGILKRCGRYALIKRDNPAVPYIVACGYDGKTGEWNQGYYFDRLSSAAKEFEELSGYACAKCPNVNDGCVICKR